MAEHFGKRHDHVLRAINNLIGGLPKSGDIPELFYKTTYVNEQNKQVYPMYLMNRDGFTLLVMGFTGKKALDWKIKYLDAFNEMEKKLRDTSSMLTDAIQRARAWADEYERLQETQEQNAPESMAWVTKC